MKITKATMKRLEKARWSETLELHRARFAMYLLDGIKTALSNCGEGNKHRRFTASGFYYDYDDYGGWTHEAKPLFIRLSIEYPDLVTAYTTHDMQFGLIKDVNKMVRILFGKLEA